jgi:hypothetical protein
LPETYVGRFGTGRVDLQIAQIKTSDGGMLNVDWVTWSEPYAVNGRVTNKYRVTVGICGQWLDTQFMEAGHQRTIEARAISIRPAQIGQC